MIIPECLLETCSSLLLVNQSRTRYILCGKYSVRSGNVFVGKTLSLHGKTELTIFADLEDTDRRECRLSGRSDMKKKIKVFA